MTEQSIHVSFDATVSCSRPTLLWFTDKIASNAVVIRRFGNRNLVRVQYSRGVLCNEFDRTAELMRSGIERQMNLAKSNISRMSNRFQLWLAHHCFFVVSSRDVPCNVPNVITLACSMCKRKVELNNSSVHTNFEASGEASDEEHSIFRDLIRRHAIAGPCCPVTLKVDGDDVPLGWGRFDQSSKNITMEDL